MDRIELFTGLHATLPDHSVVVHQFDVVGIPVTPGKANTPLVVEANAVRTFPIAPEAFQMVARRDAQIFETYRPLPVKQLPSCDSFDRLKAPDRPIVEQRLRVTALKRPYQSRFCYAIRNLSMGTLIPF
jgi:hypothetical protein